MTPNDLSREHAALVKAAAEREAQPPPAHGARDGAWSQCHGAGRSHERIPLSGCAQSAAQDNPLAGQTIDMTILGIAGWPPSRLGVDHGERAVQAVCQGDLRLRRQLLVRGGAVRRPLPEGRHVAAVRVRPVQHHHLRQPVAGRARRAGLDRPPERHHRREPRARYPVRGGRRDRLPDLPGRLRQYLRVPAGGRHHRPLRAPGPDDATRPSGTPTRPPTTAKICRRPTTSGSRSTSTATSASASTSPGRTRISTAPRSSGRRSTTSSPATPTRSCSPTAARRGIRRPARSKGLLNSEINIAGLEHNKRFLQYAPPGATNYGIAEEVDVFTAGNVATCWQWSALGPQMLNQWLAASRAKSPIREGRSPRRWC